MPNAVFGTPVPVNAVVMSRGAPVVGTAATVQFRPAGSKKWTDVQAATTGADGTVAFQVQPPTTGDWQVFVAGAPGRVEGTSAPFTTQILSQVVATPDQSRVRVRSTFIVRVTALPALARQRVALQIKQGDTWKNVARGTTNKHGRERIRATAPSAKGLYTYRVVAVGKEAILAGASAEFPIRVTRK